MIQFAFWSLQMNGRVWETSITDLSISNSPFSRKSVKKKKKHIISPISVNGQIDPEPLWVWDYTIFHFVLVEMFKAEHKVYTMHGEDLHVLCSTTIMRREDIMVQNQTRKRSLLKILPNYQKSFKIRADKMTLVYYYPYLWSKCFSKLGTPVYFFFRAR